MNPEILRRLKVKFDEETDKDDNPIQTIETVEIKRKNGDIIIQCSVNSLHMFYWNAASPLHQIIGSVSIKVSGAAEIWINPPLD